MRLAVLTGGGDCAGLNAAVRAVVRTAEHSLGSTVVGYRRGWNGIFESDSIELSNEEVRGILPHGGTILGTSRSQPGVFAQGAQPIIDRLVADGVDALVAIGGDGTLMTTDLLHRAGFPVVAIPKTIDNDVEGTDVSIGFNTALSVATDAVDRLHTTAASHDRVMVLEVMGRHAGHLALGAAVAGGAAVVLVPEQPFVIDEVAEALRRRHTRGRYASIVVVAEGAHPVPGTVPEQKVRLDAWGKPIVGGVGDLVGRLLEQATTFETRTTVLGHIQRGGSPTAADRFVASRLGVRAVEALAAGDGGHLVGIDGDGLALRPLGEVAGRTRLLSTKVLAQLQPLTTAA
ncbi:MAG: phosphofructokinase-like protein [Glaciecola sp.]|jgi:phosphofructokinase-like protein